MAVETQQSYASYFNRLSLIPSIERERYRRKGLVNTIVGFFLFFGLLFLVKEWGMRIWPEHVEDKAWFFFKWALILRIGANIFCFLWMLPGYLNLLPIYEKYKINKVSSWAWQRPDWSIMKRKLFYNILMNEVLIYSIFMYLPHFVGVKQRFLGFPSCQEIFGHMILIYLLDDSFSYWGHRIFHSFKALYKMHKIHHEYDKVFTLATEYFHPFDYVMANLVLSILYSYLD
jgi:sterol desaturase/sphingolipid hydroxylase (fatty acid hydroxylase superfamily)